jgi:hypothetical protein
MKNSRLSIFLLTYVKLFIRNVDASLCESYTNNAFKNCGFEDGLISPWNLLTLLDYEVTSGDGISNSGSYCVSTYFDGADKIISQSLTTVDQQNYYIYFAVDNQPLYSLDVSWGTTNVLQLVDHDSSATTTLIYQVTIKLCLLPNWLISILVISGVPWDRSKFI